jgi:putative transcriptional regulator
MSDVCILAHVGSPDGDPLHYTACGLDNVYLASGYQVREIGGERYVSVRDVEELHAAIAAQVIRRKFLRGKEIRFLRKHLDLTQRELGEWLDVTDQSVARYEKDQSPLDGSTDYLFRLLVIGHLTGRVNVREELEKLRNSEDSESDTLTLHRCDDEWRPSACV